MYFVALLCEDARVEGKTMTMTIRELLHDRYAPLRNSSDRTVTMMGQTIDKLEQHLGRVATLDDFTDLAMAKFLRWRATTLSRGRLVSAASVAKDKAHLASLANLAARKRLIPEFVDFPKLRVPTRPPRAYTVEEVSALIRASRHKKGHVGPVSAAWFWTTLLMAEWQTGERCGGLLRVRWPEVDLERQVITILGEHRKDHITTIERAIDDELTLMLRAHQQAAGLVWPWLEHRSHTSFFSSFQLTCKAAGVVPRGTHAIRKASGSYLHAGGGDATEHLGHRDAKTTRSHYLDTRITGRQSALSYLPPLDLGQHRAKPEEPPAA